MSKKEMPAELSAEFKDILAKTKLMELKNKEANK